MNLFDNFFVFFSTLSKLIILFFFKTNLKTPSVYPLLMVHQLTTLLHMIRFFLILSRRIQNTATTESTTPILHDPPQQELTNPKIHDLLAKTLKELDNDDLFSELEMALSRDAASITSSVKTLFTESGTSAVNVLAMKLLINCYELIEGKDLKSVGTGKELIGHLTNKLTELGPLRS